MRKIKRATLICLLSLLPIFVSAETVGDLRSKCMLADQLLTSSSELTVTEEIDALECVYAIRGAVAQHQAECVFSKVVVAEAIKEGDYWADGETIAQYSKRFFENTVDVSVSHIIKNLLNYMNEDPTQWDEPSYNVFLDLKLRYLKENPQHQCDVMAFVQRDIDELLLE